MKKATAIHMLRQIDGKFGSWQRPLGTLRAEHQARGHISQVMWNTGHERPGKFFVIREDDAFQYTRATFHDTEPHAVLGRNE